ncbi:MBL fold metallo-hydrolase [Streptomyces sp. NPDC051322]|uniref:MBL fold metallo-hydrolase n=1 Tax=Streptomyces sp. NPDC051322 TaxID=3154645 RepID=UPI00344F55A5
MDVTWEDSGWEHLAADVGRRRLPGWDATVGLIAGREAVLLYDTGSSPREGAGIRAGAAELLGRSVTHIALSHPHFDHVLGTAAFPGARVYGAVGTDHLLARGSRGAAALREEAVRHGIPPAEADDAVARLVGPHHLVSGELSLDLGGRQVVLANIGPGHTGHDLVLLVPGSPDVVFCGDLVEESGEPQAGPDAMLPQWPAALDRLLALAGDDALYVPGHGAVVDAAFVRAQREMLAARSRLS